MEYKEMINSINYNHKKKKDAEQKRINKNKLKARRIREVYTYYVILSVVVISLITGIIMLFLEKSEDVCVSYLPLTDMESTSLIIMTNDNDISYTEDYEYLAKCVMTEAGNQDEYGKRLVIDVVLNRVDNTAFPNTIKEVINQVGQFEVVSNGSIYEQIPDEYIYMLIEQELNNRTDKDVLYFKTLGYHSFAEPVIKYQDHYFSK